MKPIFALLIILCFVNPSFSEGHDNHAPKKGEFTKHFNQSLFKITDKGKFSVEMLLDQSEYKIGKDVVGIIIHDEFDRDVEGATITVSLDSINSDKPIIVTEKKEGLYTISNLDLKKEGTWKLKIKVKKKTVEDTASFIFPDAIKNRMPAGKY